MTILVIVESPGKISKIKSILGDDYTIAASIGHIRQLPKDELGFNIDDNFKPEFIISSDKADVVKNLKSLANKADKIILASDMDREGDAIAWHCAEVCNIPLDKRHRATFTEITKTAIINAIRNLGVVNMNSVHAQFARMVLDKLIGYKISPLLWKEYNNWHLSCGRVQSIVVKIISERERDINAFTSNLIFKIDANFAINKKDLELTTGNHISTTCETNISDQKHIEELYKQNTNNNIEWIIKNISKSNSKHNPSPPFITSTLQQEASIKLGLSPDVCMKTAQKLYESGLITYMRTDANFIAEDAMTAIKIYIEKKWGESYYRRMNYKTKSTNAQEGHECCRPSDISKEYITGIDGMTVHHNKLYQLIWRRTIASQMTPADYEIFTVKIHNQTQTQTQEQTQVTEITNIDNMHKKTKTKKTKLTNLIETNNSINSINSINNLDNLDTPVNINNLIFVSKYNKIIFNGFLACINLHKKQESTNTIDDNNNDNDDNDDNHDDDDDTNDNTGDDNIKLNNKSNYKSKNLETIFAQLKEGNKVYMVYSNAMQKKTKPSQARFTEASLIKKLDDLGIGRPSTYSSMIKKVQEEQRQYVEKKTLPAKQFTAVSLKYTYPDIINISKNTIKIEGDKNKLLPTSLGLMINEYLDKNFIELMNYEFTAQVEALLDDVALGSKIWYKVVESVYIKLTPIIDQLAKVVSARKLKNKITKKPNNIENIENIENIDDKKNDENENKKLLGYHPETNYPIYALKSRKGLLICESNPEKKKSRFANFTSTFNLMTLEIALTLLVFPKVLGKFLDTQPDIQTDTQPNIQQLETTQLDTEIKPALDIILKKAQNIYLSYDNKNYSIENYIKIHEKKPQYTYIDPEYITIEQARNILLYYIQQNILRLDNAKHDIILNEDIIIKVGQYGPYIKYKGTSNIPLPKAFKTHPDTITINDCNIIIEKNANKIQRCNKNNNNKYKTTSRATSGTIIAKKTIQDKIYKPIIDKQVKVKVDVDVDKPIKPVKVKVDKPVKPVKVKVDKPVKVKVDKPVKQVKVKVDKPVKQVKVKVESL